MAAVAATSEAAAGPLPHSREKPTLTPPTSDEGNKAEGSPELSDVELDDDDIGEVEPDHYFEGGKIPVFKPTMDQFRSFKKFVEKVNKYGMKSGIVKVVPPKEWRDSLPALDEAVKTIKVKNPITQDFSGAHGTYTQANIEKQRSYNLPQWKSLTEETQHQPPARRGERRKVQEKPTKPTTRSRSETSANANSTAEKRKPGRPRKSERIAKGSTAQEDDEEQNDGASVEAPPTPTSPDTAPKEVQKPKPKAKATKGSSAPKGRGQQAKSVTERRKYNRQETAEDIDEAAFEDFDYRFHDNDEFTSERCHELEDRYWKSLTFAPPMYGADMPGSLFDETCASWNVAKLENLLDVLGQKVPGVNTAYLYLGMWKATFAWHLEDVDLYSINYIHFGAPKQWYSISQEDARRFEAAMKNVWPNDAKNCSQFLRHKTYLISPNLLKSQYNITVNRLVHNEGEFVITFPYGYHSGYNLGYNCAESVNFATEDWLEYGRIAKKCDCEADSVWVDVAEIERKLRGEPTPEFYEETDDEDEDDGAADLPSPPASVAGKPKAQTGKRKRGPASKEAPRKVKKIKIKLKTSKVEPCVLCPNDLPIYQLLPTDSKGYAHEICAQYTPETMVKDTEYGEKVISGIGDILKARMDLKCHFCRSRKGSCFQCSDKKCARAYHATCAAAAGVRVELGPTVWFDPDGTEYEYEAFDFRCRFHREKRSRGRVFSIEELESSPVIRKYMRNLPKISVIQCQIQLGDIFAGSVVENRPAEQTVVVEILPEGDKFEVEWKWVLAPDPTESKLVKPSANAKPLPSHLAPHNLEASNPDYGPPVSGDPFTTVDSPQKWEEYICCDDLPRNPDRRKVDLSKENQLIYYLGKNSTETRPKFTENLQKRRDNPALHFMETLKPKIRPPPVATAPRTSNYNVANRPALNNALKQNTVPLPPPKQERPYQYKPKSEASFLPSPLGMGTPLSTASSATSPLGTNVPNSATLPPLQSKVPALSNPPAATTRPNVAANGANNQTTHNRSPSTPHPRQPSWKNQSSPLGTPRVAPVANMMAPTANMTGQRPPSQGSPPNSSTPKASAGHASQSQTADHEYLNQLSKFPYVRNSFLRRPKVYKSPYIAGGGFSSDYLTSVSNSGPKWPGSGAGAAILSTNSSSSIPHIFDAGLGGRPGSSAGQAHQRAPSSFSSSASAKSPGQGTTFSPPEMRQDSSSSASSMQFPQQQQQQPQTQPATQMPMMQGQGQMQKVEQHP